MRDPVLVISDIQFHAYKAHSRLIGGVNSRLLHQIETWKKAVQIGAQEGCKLMLIPGDIFEVRGSIRPSIFNRVTQLVMETLTQGFDIGVIPGNHDMEQLDAGESAIDCWEYLRPGNGSRPTLCKVFKDPGATELAGYRILGIPYMRDTAAFKELFRQLSSSEQPDITMIHQGVDNFNRDGAYPSTGLTAEWLEATNSGIILCGHYHCPGLSKSGRVVNVGALVQHRFSDEGSERGCWVVREERTDFFPIPSPRFMTVQKSDQIGPECTGAIVRIRATSAEEAEQLRLEAEHAGAMSVVALVEKEFQTAHEKTITIQSPRAMLDEYLGIVEKYRPRRRDILKLFDRICLG